MMLLIAFWLIWQNDVHILCYYIFIIYGFCCFRLPLLLQHEINIFRQCCILLA